MTTEGGQTMTEDQALASIQASQEKLQYLPYDVRRVVKNLGMNDLNLFYQCRLIEWCYNYSGDLVESLMGGMRKGKRVQKKKGEVNDPAQWYGQEDRLMPNRIWTGPDLVSEFDPGKKFKQNNHIKFDAICMRNLFHVDQLMLYSDYSVKWEEFLEVIEGLSFEDIVEVNTQMGEGRKYIGLVLIKLQEYDANRKRTRQELRERILTAPFQNKITPMTEESRQILERSVEELELISRKSKES